MWQGDEETGASSLEEPPDPPVFSLLWDSLLRTQQDFLWKVPENLSHTHTAEKLEDVTLFHERLSLAPVRLRGGRTGPQS